MSILILLASFVIPSWAGFNTLKVTNADIQYILPAGSGVVEKVEVDMDKSAQTGIHIQRTESAMVIDAGLVKFTWSGPEKFIHNMKLLNTQAFSMQLARGESFFTGDSVSFTSEKDAAFSFTNLEVNCQGRNIHRDPFLRFFYDCAERARVTVHKLDVPLGFLEELSGRMPPIPDDAELPADDLKVSVDQGALSAQMKVKFLVRATMKVKGHFQFEDDHKVAALRVDEVKFGILPVTNLVLSELARTNTNPNITVNPPWIRIKIK